MAEYIEREALIKSMEFNITDDPACPLFVAATVHQTIDEIPASDVRPERHGRWSFAGHGGICCSECETVYSFDELTRNSYCPNCGAKMDEKGDEKL